MNAVKKTGRQKLLMAGIVTDVRLAFPAISAVKEGDDVYGILDGSGTWSALMERSSMIRMAQAGVRLTTWIALAAELQRGLGSDHGSTIGSVIFSAFCRL